MYAILRVFMCVKILSITRSQVIDSPYDPLEILAVHVRFLDDVRSTKAFEFLLLQF